MHDEFSIDAIILLDYLKKMLGCNLIIDYEFIVWYVPMLFFQESILVIII